ncbi:methyl-accepting chemotaxis protein [Terribacillus halophilus]|uniref:Methyl-accepting chemotaxis protein n=1 Tax=Terribacillus halophilus TaxID=361279 RepID=A0A1G6ICJ9_9BACI|nr:methyl-accepting chemotaxis protein [Terribacillus halophilus]SDC03476.1 methyl-accepting chemotaxis protein [Terribacillus halophilus]
MKSFSLRFKLAIFATVLALVTYSVSGVFIYIVHPFVQQYWDVAAPVLVIGTLFLGVLWTGILAFSAARFITKPLKDLEKVATKAADGSLDEEWEVIPSNDEIGALTSAFQKMLHNLKSMISDIDANAKANDQYAKQIQNETLTASEKVVEIDEIMQTMAEGAQTTSGAVGSIVQSLDNATALSEDVRTKADQSQDLSNGMVVKLHSSQTVVMDLVHGIQRIAEKQEHSIGNVKQLENNASQIEQIIRFVSDIAEQTNLLALNASIEAARAGEQGRGFAVVADEVRKLADESRQAAQDISVNIKEIQQNIGQVVTEIDEQLALARSEAEKGSESSVVMEEMTTAIAQVVASIQEIGKLTQQQREEIASVTDQSKGVAQLAEQASAGAQEVSASVQDQASVMHNLEQLSASLEEQAGKLRDQMKQFQLTKQTSVQHAEFGKKDEQNESDSDIGPRWSKSS